MTAARKDRDKARTLLYSTTLSDIKNRETELGREASDAEVSQIAREELAG